MGYSVVVPIHGVRATRQGISGTRAVMPRSNVVTRSLPALLFAVVSVLAACEPAQPQPEALLPNLAPGRLVRMLRLPTTRGRILARDGSELATFADAGVIGIVPGQMRSPAGTAASLGAALGLTADSITAKLAQSWVRDDT